MSKISTHLQRKVSVSLWSALLLLAAVMLLSGGVAHADPPATSEPFEPPNITPGSLNGQGTPGAWQTPWQARPGQAVVEFTGRSPLSYQIPGGDLVQGGAQALEVTGRDNSLISRRFADRQSDHIYLSYLFQFTGGAVTNNDFAGFCFNDRPWCDFVDIPAIGLKAEMGPDRTDIMVRNTRGSDQYAGQVEVGQVYFIVGHLYKSSGDPDAPYDRFELWVNPAYADAGTPHAVSTGVSDLSEVSFVAMRTVNNDGDIYHFDQLTVGSTWDDVVPSSGVTAVTLGRTGTDAGGALPLWLAGLVIGVSILSVPVLRRRKTY